VKKGNRGMVKWCGLHLAVNELTFTFPKFELYELGSQLRRSSNEKSLNHWKSGKYSFLGVNI